MLEDAIPRALASSQPDRAGYGKDSGRNGNSYAAEQTQPSQPRESENGNSLQSNGNTRDQEEPMSAGLKVKIAIMNAEGGCYWAGTLADKLGLPVEEIERYREENKLLGLPVREGGFVYPKWQIVEVDGHYKILDGLEQVLALLEDSGPWEQAAFMLDRHISIYLKTPLDGLREGKLDRVLQAASGMYTQGAA